MPALGHSLFVCEYRNSVLRLLQLGGANLDQVVAEPRIINGGANACRLDIEMSPDGQIYYSHLSEIRRLILDSDSDTLEDKLDNCPNWPNPGQADPDWTIPPNDDDCDGFANSRESYLRHRRQRTLRRKQHRKQRVASRRMVPRHERRPACQYGRCRRLCGQAGPRQHGSRLDGAA